MQFLIAFVAVEACTVLYVGGFYVRVVCVEMVLCMSIKKGEEKERRMDNVSGSGNHTKQLYLVTQHSYTIKCVEPVVYTSI